VAVASKRDIFGDEFVAVFVNVHILNHRARLHAVSICVFCVLNYRCNNNWSLYAASTVALDAQLTTVNEVDKLI